MSSSFDYDDILKCNVCNSLLESPVVLPCSETICKKHVTEIKIKCKFCNNDHQVPHNGFPSDKRLSKLLSREYYKINFEENHSKAVKSCKDFEKIIDEFKTTIDYPYYKILEYFNNIRKKLDVSKKVAISNIAKKHSILSKEVEKYEEEYYKKFKKEYESQKTISEEAEKRLKLWQSKLLQDPDSREEEFSDETINVNAISSTKIINTAINDFENILLLDEIKFEVDQNILSGNFGQILVDQKVI